MSEREGLKVVFIPVHSLCYKEFYIPITKDKRIKLL